MPRSVKIINGELHMFYEYELPDRSKLELLDKAIEMVNELSELLYPKYLQVDNLKVDEIQVGAKFLIDRAPIMSSGCKYVVAECTLIHAGVIFFKYEDDGFEDYCPKDAAMWKLSGCVLALHYHTNEPYCDSHGIMTANKNADPLIKFHYESTYESYIKSLNNEGI